MTDKQQADKYVFGPVPSRRLGRSLGVDLVPFKVCTYDCLYCQLGRTSTKAVRRSDYAPAEEILAELREKIAGGAAMDYITLAGSGEPTLNVEIGRIIEAVKRMTRTPVAVLTNGALLFDRRVRAACSRADVLLPTLAAGDEALFQRIHRPARGLSLAALVAGLAAFRREFEGEIWLEVFVLAGINDTEDEMRAIKELAERIRPDRIQLNTAVRPTSESDARAVDRARLEALCEVFAPRGEVIAEFSRAREDRACAVKRQDVLALVKRRPCTVEDIAGGLGVHRNEALKYVGELVEEGALRSERRAGREYFAASGGALG